MSIFTGCKINVLIVALDEFFTFAKIQQLKKRTTGQIESLEGAACFYVCMMLKTNVIQLRAISNMVEPRNRSNWKIELAITNLNATLNLLLDELLSSE